MLSSLTELPASFAPPDTSSHISKKLEWIDTAKKIIHMEFNQLYAHCGDDIEDDETPVGRTPAAYEVSCEPFHPNYYTNYHAM
jgi:hypothetical protein